MLDATCLEIFHMKPQPEGSWAWGSVQLNPDPHETKLAMAYSQMRWFFLLEVFFLFSYRQVFFTHHFSKVAVPSVILALCKRLEFTSGTLQIYTKPRLSFPKVAPLISRIRWPALVFVLKLWHIGFCNCLRWALGSLHLCFLFLALKEFWGVHVHAHVLECVCTCVCVCLWWAIGPFT